MDERTADRILIRDLRARCVIGVFPEEREIRQEVVLNMALETDLRAAGASDALEDTVDYKSLKKRILTHVEGSSFRLIEALAESVARICLETPRVSGVEVTLDKPGALRYARSVAVDISRHRKEMP